MQPSEFETVELTSGERRFTALTLGEGPVVLCVHGFPDHHLSFRHQLPALAAAGYRAVSPMLRGYEPSSQRGRVIADHHPLRVATDLIEWARQLGAGRPVHLVGHDWGAIVAYLACGLEPRLFQSATTLAVPPLHAMDEGIRKIPSQIRNSWYVLFFQLRGLADRVVAARDFAFIEKLWRDWSPGWNWDSNDMDALKRTFREPGVLWSALAYYRAMLSPFLPETKEMRRRGQEPIEVPTLAFTGEKDGCMDTRLYGCVDTRLFPCGYRLARVSGAGHFLHQERPDEVNRLLLAWLAENSDPR